MFQPRVLKFNGGYLTYSLANKYVDVSPNLEDAFIFTTEENFRQIEENVEHYSSGYPCGFYSWEEEEKWKNPQWINIEIKVKD
jgi:hypothetical protein